MRYLIIFLLFPSVFVSCLTKKWPILLIILYINLLKLWDLTNFANVKIYEFSENCICCLAELLISWVVSDDFFLDLKRDNHLSFGLSKICKSSLLCKLVLDLQIKVSDSHGSQDSVFVASSWECLPLFTLAVII